MLNLDRSPNNTICIDCDKLYFLKLASGLFPILHVLSSGALLLPIKRWSLFHLQNRIHIKRPLWNRNSGSDITRFQRLLHKKWNDFHLTILSWEACPWNLTTTLQENLHCTEELVHVCIPASGPSQDSRWLAALASTPAIPPWFQVEQRQAVSSKSCPNYRLMRKTKVILSH